MRRIALVGPLLLLATLAVSALPAHTAAADGGLVVLAQARYEVQPADHRVHVTISAVATSYEPNTPEGQVYYSGVDFAVQPGATNVSAVSGGQQIGAAITQQRADFTVIEVTFGRGVFFQQSYAYTVSFDLVDPGGEGTRDLRIGESLAAFPAWAFGTANEPGGSVQVDLPAGYSASVEGSRMRRSEGADGGVILRAEPPDPFSFFAYVTADRPGAFTNEAIEVDVNGISTAVLVRAWEDDPGWGRWVTRLMRRGLPNLQDLIGIDYPGREPRQLVVEEAAVSRLGEYAGIYDPVTGRIRVRYDADAFVALHEAAHIWFNGTLFDSRWINEAWAEFYGVEAGRALGFKGTTFRLTDALLEVRIPLNEWGAIGLESLEVEEFAYAATYSLAQDIAGRTELGKLERVWRAVDSGEISYQPVNGEPEPGTGKATDLDDWKLLLDMLEERTGVRYTDLWREWVVNDRQARQIAERRSARQHYHEIVETAGDWELPASIRNDMSNWEFEDAVEALTTAGEVLADRRTIVAASGQLDLTSPATLREAFEGDAGLEAAASEAGAELETLELLAGGAERLADEPQLLETIGLIGNDPAAALQRARESFESGDLDAASDSAAAALSIRASAEDGGRIRVLVAGALALVLDGAGMAYGITRRRRQRSAFAEI